MPDRRYESKRGVATVSAYGDWYELVDVGIANMFEQLNEISFG